MAPAAIQVYKLSLKNYASHWWILLLYLAIFAIAHIVMTQRFGEDWTAIGIPGFAIWGFASFAPLLVLHTKFTLVNKGVSLTYFEQTGEVEIETPKLRRKFRVSEIAHVQSTKSRSLIKGSLLWFPWESSCYAVLQLKDGQQFLITSLVLPWLVWPFEVEERVRPSFYRWPSAPAGAVSR